MEVVPHDLTGYIFSLHAYIEVLVEGVGNDDQSCGVSHTPHGVCEIIRCQLYRQGFSAVRVILRPFVMADVEIGETRIVVRKRLPSRW